MSWQHVADNLRLGGHPKDGDSRNTTHVWLWRYQSVAGSDDTKRTDDESLGGTSSSSTVSETIQRNGNFYFPRKASSVQGTEASVEVSYYQMRFTFVAIIIS